MKLAVIGDPVAHSASPALHRGFLEATGIPGTYEAIRVPQGEAARAIDDLRARGYIGLNVTTPLKEEAYARADVRDAAATAAGSANTLVLGTSIAAYNTDGVGAIGALAEAGLSNISSKRILVLGAGPTARSCVVAFVAAGAHVTIWNRTASTAAHVANSLSASVWNPPYDAPDAVISALPPDVTFESAMLRTTLETAPIVVDANYGARATLAAHLARHVYDGTAMLRASAAASFAIFTASAKKTL
jgi:shikimate dehydrogenase